MTDRGLSTTRKGAQGEDAAASYLESRGWKVLARNFRTRQGEIDIIARQGDVVAFVEVKSWQSVPREDLARSIGPRKRSRIARTARLFLGGRPDLGGAHLRFDIVFLSGEGRGIEHIAGAFNEEGID
ncbi:MAG: YraN family protein [Spirochaetia bacterium]